MSPEAQVPSARAAIREALSQPASCNKQTSQLLADVLGFQAVAPKPPMTSSKASSGRSLNRAKTVSKRAVPVQTGKAATAAEERRDDTASISRSEKAKIATEVVNLSLSALVNAIRERQGAPKSASPSATRLASPSALAERSNNLPSPSARRNASKSATKARNSASQADSVAVVAECCHLAFRYLRSLGTTGKGLELETGMLSFVGKLLCFDLAHLAAKELRALRSRLLESCRKAEPKETDEQPAKTAVTRDEDSLASLLDLGVVCDDVKTLQVIVGFQVAVLRTIGISKQPSMLMAVLPLLDVNRPTSPISNILRLSSLSGDAEKAGSQLQNLAAILPSLSKATAATESDTRLRLQTNSVCTRVAMMAHVHCTLPIDDTVVAPFSKHLKAYIDTSQQDPYEQYNTARDCFEALLDVLSRFSRKSQTPASVDANKHGLYEVLSGLAHRAGLHDEALRWIKAAGSHASAALNMRRVAVVLDEACKNISRSNDCFIPEALLDPHIPPDERLQKELLSEDFLQAAADLQKSAMTFARSVTAQHKDAATAKSKKWEIMCHTLNSSCLRIFAAVLLRTSAVTYTEQQVLLVKQAAGIAVQDVVSRTFRSKTTETDITSISALLVDLRVCANIRALISPMPASKKAQEDKEEDPSGRNASLVSDACFHLYLALKEAFPTSALEALCLSCSVLHDVSPATQRRSKFPAKLTTLGRVYRAEERWQDAVAALAQAALTALSFDVAGWRSAPGNGVKEQNVEERAEMKVFNAALDAALDLNARQGLRAIGANGFLDVETLDVGRRIRLLEHQLRTMSSWNTSNTLWRHAIGTLPVLVDLLFTLYTKVNDRASQGRLCVRIFSLYSQRPGEWPSEFTARISKTTKTLLEDTQSSIATPPVIRASLVACRALQDGIVQRQAANDAIGHWHSAESSSMIKPSPEELEDISTWTKLLKALAVRFDIQGDKTLHIRALRIILEVNGAWHLPSNEEFLSASLDISVQYLRMGHTELAGKCLAMLKQREEALRTTAYHSSYFLAYAEYYITIGDQEQCRQRLSQAAASFADTQQASAPAAQGNSSSTRLLRICQESDKHHLTSRLAVAEGRLADAVSHAQVGAMLLSGTWRNLQRQLDKVNSTTPEHATSQSLDIAMSSLNLDPSQPKPTTSPSAQLFSTSVHHVLPRLVRAYLDCSKLAAFSGFRADAVHSIEQASQPAAGLGPSYLAVEAHLRKGDALIRAGELGNGQQHLQEASALLNTVDGDCNVVLLQQVSGHLHHLRKQWPPELDAYRAAQTAIQHLANPEMLQKYSKLASLPSTNDALPITTARAPKQAKATKRPPIKTSSRKTAVAGADAKVKPKRDSLQHSEMGSDVSSAMATFCQWRAELHCLEAESLLAQQATSDTRALLEGVAVETLPPPTRDQLAICWSRLLLMEAMEAMSADATLGVLAESSLSIPARRRMSSSETAECSTTASGRSPTRKGATRTKQTKSAPTNDIRVATADLLRRALTCIFERQHSLIMTSPLAGLIKAREIVVNASMMLSYIDDNVQSDIVNAPRVAFWSNLPASVAAIRDRASVQGEVASRCPSTNLSQGLEAGPCLTSFQYHLQAHTKFQSLIPDHWNIVSLSLDERSEHIIVTQYEAGCSPMLMRLPLNRQNEGADDEECFSFDDAKKELQDIIQGSDATVHATKDNPDQLKVKGAKSQWWATREALDERLKTLLENMETMWFGGFRGVLTPSQQDDHLLARFEQSLEAILDEHLPSRQSSKPRIATSKVQLDRRVFELFTSLGDAERPGFDLHEALTDLLYYVVDILQFGGEPNAYDEIDFDQILMKVHTALESYHEATKHHSKDHKQTHTILVLDKGLHCFPWESLPCLDKRSVSRVHSVVDVYERLVGMPKSNAGARGAVVSPMTGSYILNPGQDLPQTQSRFEKPLSTLALPSSNWTGTVAREPSEQEFLSALQTAKQCKTASEPHHILVYIGHGSGAQYVRHRKIKQLRFDHLNIDSKGSSDSSELQSKRASSDTLAMDTHVSAALLFGCSSASLRLHSEFEASGTPKSYMTGGAPALLGSLWDVTDGDIDKFAGSVLERWGLFEKGTFAAEEARVSKGRPKGKSKKPAETEVLEEDFGTMSLSDAAARSRDDCYLRYLNGAAMVVYGVPTYIDQENTRRRGAA